MTPIPDNHPTFKKLRDDLERAGREMERSMARSARRRRARRVAIVVLTLLGLAAAAVGARELIDDSSPVPPDPRPLPPDRRRAVEDARLSPVQVPDPAGGLPWGARTYTSVRGGACVVVGRVRQGRVGVLVGRRFSPLPRAAQGACAPDADDHIAFSVRLYPGPDAGRSVVYGVVDRAVTSMSLRRLGRFSPVEIAPDGVFLVVRAGTTALRGARLRWVEDGRRHEVRLLR
jgi:hypothetical protein